MKRTPLKRKTPLPRNWFKSTAPGPRTSPDYKTAVLMAFETYMLGDGYCRCAFCGRVYPLEEIAACRIFHKGSCAELFCEPLNLLPGDYKCHGEFDAKTTEERRRQIEDILPGRWAELEEIRVDHLKGVRIGGVVEGRPGPKPPRHRTLNR